MTRRRCTGLLWVALVVCAPFPFVLVETGREPVVAILAMLGSVLALIAIEGSAGAVALAAWILAAQVLVSLAFLGIVAVALTRIVESVAGRRRDAVVGVLILALLGVALTQPIYRTPFRPAGLHATLSEVFE